MMKHTQPGLVAFFVCVTLMWAVTAFATPNIEFTDGLTFDFGDVKANTTLEHTFVFTNTGDQVLHIPQVKGG
jgi:hypothetical protein